MARRRGPTILLCGLLAGALALAQEPPGPPQPGPEHERLGWFVGKWSGTGDLMAGSWGPGRTMSWTETCEWYEGGFGLVCHREVNGPLGKLKALGIVAYDPEEKVYLHFAVSSSGEVTRGKGTAQGKTWTWTGEVLVGGQVLNVRNTLIEESKDSYSFKSESSFAGGPWTAMMEAKANRVK